MGLGNVGEEGRGGGGGLNRVQCVLKKLSKIILPAKKKKKNNFSERGMVVESGIIRAIQAGSSPSLAHFVP